ncbi:hypothetical protein V2J09_019702 [Rumex salicifolius]
MQYASPKAIWNVIFGVTSPGFVSKAGETRNTRVKQFTTYISDLENKGSGIIVPEFPSKLDWLNTAPLQFRRDLKGKVVVLDFWTYCCINCMHVLPDLEFLEKKYKDKPFVVVGVHSAKFDNEKDLKAIRNAVLRYNVTHPVVNDGDMNLWRELGVNSWPTCAVVGPNGRLLAQLSGEGHRKDLDDLVDAALSFYGRKNMLDDSPLPISLEKDNDPRLLTSPLKFPGKLAVDLVNNRLFISDSSHNRIVVTDLDGNFLLQVGSTGEDGLRDGNFDDVTFNRPQGLAYNAKKNILYVADTENHALREIDFVSESVRTLAGNGTKGSDYSGGGKGNTQLLNSPWDVCFHPVNEKVYIAMAGQHQIWEHDILDETTKVFSGDGYERNLNGSSSSTTSFAQPSGMSLSPDLKEIYIADSESSSIRALDLKTGGSKLLAGGDPLFADNLFKYGDHDGTGSEVLLQHPLGVYCGQNGQVYIADSYNHKIKVLDPSKKRVESLAGIGKAGFKDGSALKSQLSEPSGIVEVGNGRLLVADTNNNAIRYLDLNQGEVGTLELKGVKPPASKSKPLKRLRRRLSADTQIVTVDGGSSKEGNLLLKISVPEGYHFSKGILTRMGLLPFTSKEILLQLHQEELIARLVYYCKEDEVCLYQSVAFDVSFKEVIADSNSPAEISIEYVVKPRDGQGSSLQLPAAI